MKRLLSILPCFMSVATFANLEVTMYSTHKDQVQPVGTIVVQETPYGLLFTPNLRGLPSGVHGFHVHQHPSCVDHGMGSGGHLDPNRTNKHLGPYNPEGHLGDLPALYVEKDGTATLPVLAPKLKKIKAIESHALIIHEGKDNYQDTPEKLGGGKSRMFCGRVKIR